MLREVDQNHWLQKLLEKCTLYLNILKIVSKQCQYSTYQKKNKHLKKKKNT